MKSRKDFFAFWLIVIWIIVGILTGVYAVGTYLGQRRNAEKFFGVNIVWDLTEEEKTLLQPMVKKELTSMSGDYAEAVAAETKFFEERDTIVPATAEETLNKYREAQKRTKDFRFLLDGACGTVEYYTLLDDDSQWCS